MKLLKTPAFVPDQTDQITYTVSNLETGITESILASSVQEAAKIYNLKHGLTVTLEIVSVEPELLEGENVEPETSQESN